MEGEIKMANYHVMYQALFNKVTDAIHILQSAQLETEGMYTDHDPANIRLLRPGGDDSSDDDSSDDEDNE